MEDPILAVTDGQNLQNITLRLSKEEAETCLSRLMGFTGPARPTWPLITALGQVVFADRIGLQPRSFGVIKFDLDTESLRQKLEELRSGRESQPAPFVPESDEPNEDPFRHYVKTHEANGEAVGSPTEPSEESALRTNSPEIPDSSKLDASGPGHLVRLSEAKALIAVNHITKSAALACEEAAMTHEDYALLKLWLKRSFDCTTNALGRSSGVSVEQLKERIRAQSVAGTLIIENNGLSPTVLTKGKAAPTVKPIDLAAAGQDDEKADPPKVRQVLSPGRAAEICRSRKAIGTLENRLLEAFIQSGQKVDTFVSGLESVLGMVVVP
jgi:hypothetical protein